MAKQSQNEHPETNYVGVFVALVIAFGAALVLGVLDPNPLAITLIFALAGFKAYLVITRFMHLSPEPRFIKVMVLMVLFILLVLYAGLIPDIVTDPRKLAP